MGKIEEVIVNLPEDQIAFLQRVAASEQLSFTDVLRRAIEFERFLMEQSEAGNKILVEVGGRYKKLHEVLRA
jgi:hypothetical protein